MAEVVDSIIAELIVKNEAYVRGFNEATAAHERFLTSTTKLKANTFDLQAEGQKYKAGADKIAQAEQQTTDVIKRSRKARVDAVKQSGDAEVAAEKATQDRITAMVDRGVAERAARQRRGASTLGGTAEPGTRATVARQTEIARQTVVPAAAEAEAQREVNAAVVEQVRLQAGLASARGADRALIREQIADMRTYNQLLRAGLDEEAAAVELDRIRVARARELAVQSARSGSGNLRQALGGATLGYAPGGAAFAGIAAAGAVAGGVAAVSGAVGFAKDIKDTADAVGLTTRQVQIYQAAARDAGVSTDQFRSGIGQLNSYLGRAKEGDEQAAKTFAALGINIKNAASAGDVLPTLIDRLSKIPDAATRAALETRLFGEEGRRLDSVLSGGNGKINELAEALERAGAILSSSDIAKLDDVAKKLAEVKAQLSARLAGIVADNAGAILSLVDAFARLANEIGNAVQAYQRFTNFRVGPGAAQGGGARAGDVASFLNPLTAPTAVGGLIGGAIGRLLPSGSPKQNGITVPLDAPQAGSSDAAAIAKLFAPKGPRGKSADTLAAEAAERTKRFNDQLANYQAEQLRAEAEQTGNINDRAAIESKLAEDARNRQIADINSQRDINIRHGGNAELEEARASILRQAVTQATAASEATREQQVSIDLAKQANDHVQTRLSIEADMLDSSQALARTSADRLALALRLLDIEKQQERANLQNQIDTAKPGTDLTDVRARLGSLDQRYAGRQAVARDQNLSPGQQYSRSLEVTSDTIQDEQVRLLDRFNKGLDDSVAKALHLHGIFGDIVKDLIDMAIKQALIKPLAGALFGGSGGGGGLGGLLGGVGKFLGIGGGGGSAALDSSIDPSLFGLAGGGSFVVGGNGGIDRNVLSINGRPTVRVNQGETINVVPANMQARASSAQPMTLHQTINVDGRNSVTPSDFANQIISVSADHANRVAAQAGRSAVLASPSQVRQTQTLKG